MEKWSKRQFGQKMWPKVISNDTEIDAPEEKPLELESTLLDPEIIALSYIVEVLMPLTKRQRERILTYAFEKLEDDSGPTRVNRACETRAKEDE